MSNIRFPAAPPKLPPDVEIPRELELWVNDMEMWSTALHRIVENAVGRLIDQARPPSLPVLLPPATVAQLETNSPRKFKAAKPRNGGCGLVYCTDEIGGAVPAYSDGTNWKRVTDGATVS
jgi:hypothetical protein